jgi:hypothetical protein
MYGAESGCRRAAGKAKICRRCAGLPPLITSNESNRVGDYVWHMDCIGSVLL